VPELTEPSISVVVPTHDRPMKLARLLRTFDDLSVKPDQITVVSDSTVADSRDPLKKWESAPHDFHAAVLKQESGKGPANARNLGTKASSGEIVAFTDDDCITHPDWVLNLSKSINRHDKIIGVGGKVLPIRDDMISRYYSYYKILEPPSSLDYLVSANCCYFRDEVLDVGGFEEDIRKPGGEDVGLSFKLARKGWRFDKAEDAIIFHDYRSSVRDLGRTFWNYGQGCRRVTARYLVESEADLGTKSAPRGGYGYGPLSPAKITPGILTRDTLAEFRSLQAERSGSEVVAFSTLRLVQRLAYYYGWKAG